MRASLPEAVAKQALRMERREEDLGQLPKQMGMAIMIQPLDYTLDVYI